MTDFTTAPRKALMTGLGGSGRINHMCRDPHPGGTSLRVQNQVVRDQYYFDAIYLIPLELHRPGDNCYSASS